MMDQHIKKMREEQNSLTAVVDAYLIVTILVVSPLLVYVFVVFEPAVIAGLVLIAHGVWFQ